MIIFIVVNWNEPSPCFGQGCRCETHDAPRAQAPPVWVQAPPAQAQAQAPPAQAQAPPALAQALPTQAQAPMAQARVPFRLLKDALLLFFMAVFVFILFREPISRINVALPEFPLTGHTACVNITTINNFFYVY
jgi:hypothetical protein